MSFVLVLGDEPRGMIDRKHWNGAGNQSIKHSLRGRNTIPYHTIP